MRRGLILSLVLVLIILMVSCQAGEGFPTRGDKNTAKYEVVPSSGGYSMYVESFKILSDNVLEVTVDGKTYTLNGTLWDYVTPYTDNR